CLRRTAQEETAHTGRSSQGAGTDRPDRKGRAGHEGCGGNDLHLPARPLHVVMPGSDSTGISRKVEGDGERKKLKELAAQMTFREGVGYIIRTEAMGKTLEE